MAGESERPDWLLEGVEFELSGDFLTPSAEAISPENQNVHEIAIAAQPEGARRFKSASLQQPVGLLKRATTFDIEYCSNCS